MLLKPIMTNLSVLNKKIRSIALSQEFGLLDWFSIYRIEEDSRSCEWHMSMFVLLMPSLLEISIFSTSIVLLQVELSSISELA